MKKILITLVLVSLTNSLSALNYEVYDENSNYFSGDICANAPYKVFMDQEHAEVVLKDSKTNLILKVYNFNDYENEIIFPFYSEEVTFEVFALNELGQTDKPPIIFKKSITDCGYDSALEDLKVTVLPINVEYKDEGIVITNNKETNVEVFYQLIDSDRSIKEKMLPKGSFTIQAEPNDIVQIQLNDDGKLSYYEISLYDNYNFDLRELSNLTLNTVDKRSLINVKILGYLMFSVLIMVLSLIRINKINRKIKKKNGRR